MMQKRKRTTKKNGISARCRAGSLLALVAVGFTAAFSSFSSFFTLPRGQRKASAESAPQTAVQSDSLFLPGNYEEYLALENPASVAVTERYTAIADGLKIYIFDRAANSYRYYSHDIVGDTQITQLKFDQADTLYFTAQSSTHLYTLNLNGFEVSDTNIACSAFEIYGDELYYTTISEKAAISSRSLNALGSSRAPLKEGVLGKPAIAHNGETLYYTVGEMLACIGGTDAQTIAPASVQSLTFSGDYCYYTDTNKDLYALRYAERGAQREKIAENCVSVSSPCNGFIYVVGDRKIRQLNAETREFTSYEISASSSSQGRLYAATDATLCGNTLVTLDKGSAEENVPARIHLTSANQSGQAAQNTRSCILSDLSGTAKLVASDGKTACVASAVTASGGVESGVLTFYDLSSEENTLQPCFTYAAESGEAFVGVACVYGTYYAASKTRFYKISPAGTTSEETEGGTAEGYAVTSRASRRANELLSCDVYGTLYVAQSDKKIYAFSESEFAEETSGITETATAALPTGADPLVRPSKLLVDFHRGIYVLQGGAIVKCAASAEETPVSYAMNDKSFVYAQTAETPVVSAAFGVETGAAYVIYNGNFIAASYDLPLPTVHTVPVNGTDETLFSQSAARFCVAECPEKTFLLRVDLSTLGGAEYFPCVSYGRTEKKISAISLAETEKYALLAVYDKEANDYYTALAEKSSCTSVSEEEFLAPPPEQFQNGAKGYVTNALSLYKYPYLTPLLTVCPLNKNAEVTVLKTVRKLDWTYYQVEYTNADGITQTGFLPAAYVSDTSGSAPQAQTTVRGEENNNRDLVWRLVYLVLGTLVVCILTDYLILRKNDKD
ncbi:MAG: hypothetical protein SPH68_02430 [Candidatus Borkfalkiaceae bacterium]|nr:hypothetical protein [Clostridia bacterium]MDY6223003.1 hypothetical protein [Christensenellaceae bacterium]